MRDKKIHCPVSNKENFGSTIYFDGYGSLDNIQYSLRLHDPDSEINDQSIPHICIQDSDDGTNEFSLLSKVHSDPRFFRVNRKGLKEFLKNHPGLMGIPKFANPSNEFVNFVNETYNDIFNEYLNALVSREKPETTNLLVVENLHSSMIGHSANKILSELLKLNKFEVSHIVEATKNEMITLFCVMDKIISTKATHILTIHDPFPIDVPFLKSFCWLQDPNTKGTSISKGTTILEISPEVGKIIDPNNKHKHVKFEMPVEDIDCSSSSKKYDVTFLSNLGSVDDFPIEPSLTSFLIEKCIQRLNDRKKPIFFGEKFNKFIDSCGIDIPKDQKEIIVHHHMTYIERFAHRIYHMRRVVKAVRELGYTLDIYGRGWKDTEFVGFHRGSLTRKDAMKTISESRCTIHINSLDILHPRQLESAQLGTHCINPADFTDDDLMAVIQACVENKIDVDTSIIDGNTYADRAKTLSELVLETVNC